MNKYINKLSSDDLNNIHSIQIKALREIDRLCIKHGINYSLAYGTLLGAVRHKGFIPWDDDVDLVMLRKDYDKFGEICKKELCGAYFYQSHDTESEYFRLYNKIRVNGTVFKEVAHENHSIHQGVYIDIFPLDYVPDNFFKRKIQCIQYEFWHIILSSRYISIHNRDGIKRIIAKLISLLSGPVKLDFIYKQLIRITTKYNHSKQHMVYNFETPYKKKDLFCGKYFEDTVREKFENIEVSVIKNRDFILSTIYGNYMKLPKKEQRQTQHKLIEFKLR